SGKLAILIADNGGDVDRIKDSLKNKAKSKIPFYSSDEEEEKEERRREEEEDREQNGDSSISSILLRKAKDKVKEKLPFVGRAITTTMTTTMIMRASSDPYSTKQNAAEYSKYYAIFYY
ncbi:Uncharacterized protein FKW44_011362, partial [Caligus rogercresseyi]